MGRVKDHFHDEICNSPDEPGLDWDPEDYCPSCLYLECICSTFQQRVKYWLLECLGEENAQDIKTRNFRFLEEALELVQAHECTAEEAHKLVDYVYGRPQGDVNQEVGGVMVTLAALCSAHGLDMAAEGERELERVNTPEIMAKVRAKQEGKPSPGSPLPGKYEGDNNG